MGQCQAAGGLVLNPVERDLAASVVAVSPVMRELLDVARRLAAARGAVLLEGESGTGKDLIAHLIHGSSARKDGPLIKIHCPSIPSDLVESELFGHEKGAFTDAREAKSGKIEMATGGTLYLDQIQDLDLTQQAKLLRVVEEQRFERVGGTKTIVVDVRIVSSSNVDLRDAVRGGTFREDLYHRLSVLPLTIPPLRSRREDIPPLTELFLRRQRERGATEATGFDPEALEALAGYHWPGNVRELRSAVERSCLFASGHAIPLRALPGQILEQPATLWAGRERRPSLKAVEEAYIRYVLDAVASNQTRAAAILGISRKSLWEKRRRYRIQ